MVLTAKYLRFACDQTSILPVLDDLTGLRPTFYRGAQAQVQGALFNGPPSAGSFAAVTGIQHVELICRKYNLTGNVLFDIVQPVLNAVATFATWDNGTAQQFVFDIPANVLSYKGLDSGRLPLYFIVQGATTSTNFIACQGFGEIVDVGLANVSAPVPPGAFQSFIPSSGGSDSIIVVGGGTSVLITPAVGAGPYVRNYLLLVANQLPGAEIDMVINFPASSNPTIKVYNDTALGTLLATVVGYSDFTSSRHMFFRFDGTKWILFGPDVT